LCKSGYVGSNRKEGGRKIWIPVICILLTFIAFQITIMYSTFNIDRKRTKSSVIRYFLVARYEITKFTQKKNVQFDSYMARGNFVNPLAPELFF